MDAAIASIVTAIITVIGAVFVAKINNRQKDNACVKHRLELEEKNKRILESPKHHYFFAKMRYFITSVIPCIHNNVDIPKIKVSMLKMFLIIKFTTFMDGMEEWVNHEDSVKLNECVKYITMLIDKYEKEAIASGIPKIFVESFAKEHEAYVTSTVQSIEQIMRCESYTNVDKENSILDILLLTFTMTIYSAERTAKNMNGELESALLKIEDKKG